MFYSKESKTTRIRKLVEMTIKASYYLPANKDNWDMGERCHWLAARIAILYKRGRN